MKSSRERDAQISRRAFVERAALLASGVSTGALLSSCASNKAQPREEKRIDTTLLPAGTAPAALPVPHFPSRLHAFVWRNWQLVPAERLAAAVGATAADIRALARRMGLPKQPRISAEQQRRSYVSVIKRNWHLLPYEQVLQILGWTASELAYTLREDDFLWIKLGSLKPKCDPLRWDRADAARSSDVAQVIRQEFGSIDISAVEDPLFSFVGKLSSMPAHRHETSSRKDRPLRFCYSYFAVYGDPLLDADLDPYPEGYLARLAESGVTGVWLQGVLHKLAPFAWQPALSAEHERRLANLRQLVSRAEEHGIRVFLYLNEPRAMPARFFQEREDLKGVREGDYYAMCTSTAAVRDWMRDSIAYICQKVPSLGGFFTITASENLSNCWSHHSGKSCPRCSTRSPAEVIAEVNATIQDGIETSGTGQQLLAWDWGWSAEWALDAVDRLPRSVALMSVSEWDLPIDRGGVANQVGEYSLSAIGPGPRAKAHWAKAKARGMRVIAKIQAGNTWELSAVPWIPVAANVVTHIERLRELDVDGVMLGWTLGGYPSPNLQAVAAAMNGEDVERLAQKRFGPMLAPHFVTAWKSFGSAFAEFPFDGGVVYGAPLQNGPSNLLWAEPTHYRLSMVGFPYDDLNGWRARYPADTFITQMRKVADGFDAALVTLQQEVTAQAAADEYREAIVEEMRMARVAALHWRSVVNQAQFVTMRDRLLALAPTAQATALLQDLAALLRNEIDLARELHAIQKADSRIGFEATNHYYYVPLDLAEKVINARHLLDHWLPAQRARFAATGAERRQIWE